VVFRETLYSFVRVFFRVDCPLANGRPVIASALNIAVSKKKKNRKKKAPIRLRKYIYINKNFISFFLT